MFVFCSNRNDSSSNIIEHARPFVSSWIKSSEDDYNFPIYPTIKKHDDGWGSFQYFLTEDQREHIQLQRKPTPIFKDDYTLSIDTNDPQHYILLNHSRKASPSMPISLDQNHPFVSESGNLVLIHNGTTNKDVLNTFLKEPLTDLDNISDTQVLFMILKEKFDNDNNFPLSENYTIWKKLVDDIKDKHAEQQVHYSLNLILLVKEQSTDSFNVFYSSIYSRLNFDKYLNLYEFKNTNYTVICSSTIKEYYEKEFADNLKTYTVRLLPNGAVGMVNITTNEQQEEKIELKLF